MKLCELIVNLNRLYDKYGDKDIVIDGNCCVKKDCYAQFKTARLLNISEVSLLSGEREENNETYEVILLS